MDWVNDTYMAAKGEHEIVLLTEWNEFRALNLERVAAEMAAPAMADLRNIYSADTVIAAGFEQYVSVGRQHASADAS